MKKTILKLLIVAVAIMATCCKNHSDANFTVTGEIENVEDNYLILLFKSNVDDSTTHIAEDTLRNGCFEFTAPAETGVQYHIFAPDVVQKKINESTEGSLLRLLFFFSILPLILALSGIMAMSTFYVTSHRRDISIRKIFGGTVGQESRTYLWKFLRIMFIGNLIGIPLASWINGSIYLGIPMSEVSSIWIYLLTFAISMLMAFMCVFPQVFQATRTNPATELTKE